MATPNDISPTSGRLPKDGIDHFRSIFDHFRSVFEHISEVVFRTDTEGRWTFLNPAWTDLTGFSVKESLGANFLSFIHEEDRETALKALRQCVEHGHPSYEYENRYRTRAGEFRLVNTYMRILRDESGAVAGITGTLTDITGQKEAQTALQKLTDDLDCVRQEAAATVQAKSAFLATMSHEIRTPLNALIGMTGLLMDTTLDENQRKYAEIIHTSGETLLAIIDNILDFSKIEAGKIELERQAFEVRACLESALDLVAAAAARKQIELTYFVENDVPAFLMGDVSYLRQVLVNLLSNAVKFTDEGEVKASLSVGAGQLHVCVSDTGVGIPDEKRRHLFEPFAQVDAATRRTNGGTGLGLSISSQLIELMGGMIWMDSEMGQGSAFYFTIPAPEATGGDLAGDESTFKDVSKEECLSLAGKEALIINDNETRSLMLCQLLDGWQMNVHLARTESEAMDLLQANEKTAVAIADSSLLEFEDDPAANPISEAYPDLPVIMIASIGAGPGPGGGPAILHKPVKRAALRELLLDAIEGPERTRTPQKPAHDEMASGMNPMRILLVEDNDVNRKVMLRMLERIGYDADTACDGVEALQAIKSTAYDIVLMDVQMPNMDGLEATRRVRSEVPAAAQPSIIAITANALRGDRETCIEAGMDDYIEKPIRMVELVAGLRRFAPSRDDAHGFEIPTGGDGMGDGHLPPVFDVATFRDLDEMMNAEDPVFLQGLVQDFLKDAQERIQVIETAIVQSDHKAVEHAAHTLKSSSLLFGALRLSMLCSQLEKAAMNERLEEEDIPPPENLRHAFAGAQEAMEAY